MKKFSLILYFQKFFYPARTTLGLTEQVTTQSIYIKEACLSVCLFVCSDLESKLLYGSQPNLA